MPEPPRSHEELHASWHEIFLRFKQTPVTELQVGATGPMEACYAALDDRLADKWWHYLDVYDRHLTRFRGTEVRILEIGVWHGGSLQLWRRYLGQDARIHGLDIDPVAAQIDDPDLVVHLGDQANPADLDEVIRQMGGIDVVIDDGSHQCADQISSFEFLFPRLSERGVYICEDLHTSYWRFFGGGLGRRGTFIERLKGLLDDLHARYLEPWDSLDADPRFAGVHSVSVYDSIAVIEKRPPVEPFRAVAGSRTLT